VLRTFVRFFTKCQTTEGTNLAADDWWKLAQICPLKFGKLSAARFIRVYNDILYDSRGHHSVIGKRGVGGSALFLVFKNHELVGGHVETPDSIKRKQYLGGVFNVILYFI